MRVVMTVAEVQVEGRVERVHNGVVEGWAWQPGAEQERLVVRALIDGVEVATGMAELARDSLAAAGIGDGRHGFRVALPNNGKVVDPGRHVLRVEAADAALPPAARFSVSAEDHASPWREVEFELDDGHAIRAPLDPAQPEVEGRVELVRDGVVEGWAWRPGDTGHRVALSVLLDGEEVGAAVAELARPSLETAGIGDGGHAFRFALPPDRAYPGRRALTVEADGVALPAASSFRTETGRTDDPWYGAQFWLDDHRNGGEPPDRRPSYASIEEAAEEHQPGEPGTPVLGRDGWLFDAGMLVPATDEQAIATEARIVEAIDGFDQLHRRLSELGVKLLPVLIPTKEHVYAERLPWPGAAALRARPGEALVEGLMLHPLLDQLDLLPALRAGASERPVYAPLRPQLSEWGIYCAYRALIKRIGAILPDVPPPVELPESNVLMAPTQEPIVMMPEGAPPATPREDLARLDAPSVLGWEQPHRRELPRAVLVGAAEHAGLAEWCGRHFRFTVMLGRDAPLIDLVSLERPDVVVQLIDERSLIEVPAVMPMLPARTDDDGHHENRPLLHPGRRAPALPAQVGGLPDRSDSRLPVVWTGEPRALSTVERRLPIALPSPALRVRAAESLAGPWGVLAGGFLAYFVIFLYLTRHFGFFGDEWSFIQDRRPWNLTVFLAAYQQHLELIPVTVYKLLFATVGLSSTLPYRIIVFGLHFVCAAGLYVVARARLGRWLALIPAGLLLVLGAAFEVELWPVNISFIAAMAAGVWALALLDRGDRRSAVGAAVLVGCSLASASVSLPFALAIGAELLMTRARRIWVVAVPLLLYLIWYLNYGRSDVVWANLPHVPLYDVKIAAYGFAGLAGLSSETFGASGFVLVVGLLMLVASVVWLLVRRVTTRRLPPRVVTGVLAALMFWTATALARAQFGQPDASRYIYASATFILLAATALRWRRPVTQRSVAIITTAFCVVAALGLVSLRQWARDRTGVDTLQRVRLGAAEIAGRAGYANFQPDPAHIPYIRLGHYLTIVKQLGSPAYTPAEIEQQPADSREQADAVLVAAERIAVRKVGLPKGSSCSLVIGNAPTVISVPPDRWLYFHAAQRTQVQVQLRRLSPVFSGALETTVRGGYTFAFYFPRDNSRLPWRAELRLLAQSKHVTLTLETCLGRSAARRVGRGSR